MKTFKDSAGRDWSVTVDFGALLRVRDATGVDLLKIHEDNFSVLNRISTDLLLLIQILALLCESQFQGKGLTRDQFCAAMAGDSIEQAHRALIDDLIDFFPDARKRAWMKKVVEKADQMTTIVLQKTEAKIDQADLEAMAEELINSSGKPPASSASIPAP